MVNITLNTKTRSCIANSEFLGYEGENAANKLVFNFLDEFIDGSAQLNIKRGAENGYVTLVKVGETYELEVKSSLVSQVGKITFQLQISKSDGTIYKFDTLVMTVKDAIDTDVPIPEDYPTWQEAMATALAQVENIDIRANKIDDIATISITDKNGVITEVEIHDGKDGENGKDAISPILKSEQLESGTKITITDIEGTKEVVLKDGLDGKNGVSPLVTTTQTDTGATITIVDEAGIHTATLLNGKDGKDAEGLEIETDPIYSADKPNLALKSELPTKLSELNNDKGYITGYTETDPLYSADKSKIALKTEIPTKTSQLANDSSFATESFVTNKIAEAELSGGDVDLSGYATKEELNSKANLEDIPTKVSALTNDVGYITGYTETDPTVPAHVKDITTADITKWNNKSEFSGNYNDLTNKPTIPSIEGLVTSEELTQGLSTKQDVLTAGANITIENGVISANGAGGITEIPVATADTLGGIKVGEGLEITVDGKLNVENVVVEATGASSNPIGTIIPFMGTTPPKDYLTCDGTVYNIADYMELSSHFLNQFGSKNYFGGDGTTTFAVPDLRNEFLRGYHCGGKKLSSEIGIHQDATAIPFLGYDNANGNFFSSAKATSNSTSIYGVDGRVSTTNTTGSFAKSDGTFTDTSGYSHGYVRPTNVAVLYCIKYTVSSEEIEIESTPTMNSNKVVTSGGVKSYVDTQVNNAVLPKADTTYVNSQISAVNTTLASKADTSYVNTELAKKADTSTVNTALAGKADTSHTQGAATITAGTLAGQVNANATAVANVGTSQVRNITASTTDLTAGTSSLATGEIYFVYE